MEFGAVLIALRARNKRSRFCNYTVVLSVSVSIQVHYQELKSSKSSRAITFIVAPCARSFSVGHYRERLAQIDESFMLLESSGTLQGPLADVTWV
jgi:hypothetical protein